MHLIWTTFLAVVAYVPVATVLTFVAIFFLRPITRALSRVIGGPAAAEEYRHAEGETSARFLDIEMQKGWYYFTGMNFFLMLMVMAVYFVLAWLAISYFNVWAPALYTVAGLFSLNYWVNIAAPLNRSWPERTMADLKRQASFPCANCNHEVDRHVFDDATKPLRPCIDCNCARYDLMCSCGHISREHDIGRGKCVRCGCKKFEPASLRA